MTTYLGIDASLTATGLALVRGNKVLATETLSAPKGVTGAPRLMHMRDQLQVFLDRQTEDIAAVCIEGYAYGATGKSYDIGEWGGVVRLLLYERGHRVFTLDNGNVKKFACGKANVSGKPPVVMAVYRMTGLDLSSAHDEADAVVCGLAVQAYLSVKKAEQDNTNFGDLRLTIAQWEALQKMHALPAKRRRTR